MMILSLNLVLVLVAFFHSIPSSSSLPMYEQGFNLCHSSGQVTAQLRTGQQVPADARTTAFVHALAYKQAEAEAESRAGGAMRVGYTSTTAEDELKTLKVEPCRSRWWEIPGMLGQRLHDLATSPLRFLSYLRGK
ncbi:hypothetical protein PSTG_15683 [Puccinia striiformis f. sp. tritici PST-78]|uniref:Uncharacterized protein n=1 Tax=Puccinia striiformis f. sp. tritici PST-78 TaxID=1165861 RepID=A0A0L0UV35_9BASI|nr:hypothetical protein PSTG_15683 [Puccinia striiformis f. sp. tritici PST-78]